VPILTPVLLAPGAEFVPLWLPVEPAVLWSELPLLLVEPVLLLLPVLPVLPPVCAAAPATTAMLSIAESANLFMPSYLSDFWGISAQTSRMPRSAGVFDFTAASSYGGGVP